MKFVVFNKYDQPIYLINDDFEFFYYRNRDRLSDEEQLRLKKEIGNWTIPEHRCVNRRTGEMTTTRLLYEKSLKTDLDDPDTQSWIDTRRLNGYNEATIADDLGISTKTLQRRYPPNKTAKHSWLH